MDIRCMKCKKMTPSVDEKIVRMKNGMERIAAKCSICGSGKSKILGKAK